MATLTAMAAEGEREVWRGTVTSGTSVYLRVPRNNLARPLSVAAKSLGAGTVLASFTIASKEMVEADDANVMWFDWDIGATAAAATDIVMAVATVIRVTAAGADAYAEVVQ